MKTYLLVLAFLVPASCFAQSVEYSVSRCACDSPAQPSEQEFDEISSVWLDDTTLRVIAWELEDAWTSIDDGPGAIEQGLPGEITLYYRIHKNHYSDNEPISMCEDSVKLVFVVHGLKKAKYNVKVASQIRSDSSAEMAN